MKCLVLTCGSHLHFLGILVVLRLIFCAISSVKSGCEPIKSSVPDDFDNSVHKQSIY